MTKKSKRIIAASLACAALVPTLSLTMGSGLAERPMPPYKTELTEEEQALFDQSIKNFDLNELLTGLNEAKNTDWAASYIEYVSPVWLEWEGMYGAYLDFDGDNGYLIMSLDYTMPRYSTRRVVFSLFMHGDLAILRDGRELYYRDGLSYYENGKNHYLGGPDLFDF